MPSKSPEQAKLMRIAANNAKFAKKVGIPQTVADEFYRADKVAARKGFDEGGPVRGDGCATRGKTRGSVM